MSTEEKKFPSRICTSSKRETAIVLSLGLVCVCSYICYSLPAPFFTIKATQRGISRTVIGILFAMFEFVIFILSPLIGKYLSTLGYRKVFFVGVILSGVSTMIIGVLNYIPDKNVFIVSCFVVRFLEAVGSAACLTSVYAIVARAFPKKIPSVMIGGFGLPFYTTGAMLILTGIFCFFAIPKSTDKEDNSSMSVFILLKNPSIMITGLMILIAASGIGFLEPTLAIQLKELDLSTAEAGGFFVLLPFVYALSSPLWGYINEKKDCGRCMMNIALIFAFLSFLMFGPTPLIPFIKSSIAQLTLSSIFFGMSMSCILVPTLPYILKSVSFEGHSKDGMAVYGIVAGFESASFSLGAFIGPLLGGIMVDNLKFPTASTIYAFMFLIVALIGGIKALVDKIKSKKQSQCILTNLTHIDISDRTDIITSVVDNNKKVVTDISDRTDIIQAAVDNDITVVSDISDRTNVIKSAVDNNNTIVTDLCDITNKLTSAVDNDNKSVTDISDNTDIITAVL
ncbi:MFS-type transporter SLC18B1-like isoform X4 [Mytilus edulis]|uniref:MFS-type transporter SLC18B1-like isoform X4 n=1 Tax=Mytilus edulis TaxID=6550 RepID=UPI0039EED70F